MELSEKRVEFSVVMPVYNEENIIANSIRRTLEVLDTSNIFFELLVVNDGSSDRTIESLEEFRDRISMLSYGKNMGKGYALRYGASRAKGKIIAFYDSDLNIDPSHLVKYFSELKANDIDVLVGSKRLRGSVIKSSFARQFLSISYHLIAKALFGLKVMDTQVGIKVFKSEVLKEILPVLSIDRFAFDVELLVLASRFGYKIAELPVSINMQTGLSNISVRAIGKMFIDTLEILYKLRIAKDPADRYHLPERSIRKNV